MTPEANRNKKAKLYAEACDNEPGSFLSRDLEAIREKAFIVGHSTAKAEDAEKLRELREHLKLALSFCPKGPVPEGLDPTFYHTLNYQEEIKLQERIDKAREALERLGE